MTIMSTDVEALSDKDVDELTALIAYDYGARSEAIAGSATGNPCATKTYQPTRDKSQAMDLVVTFRLVVNMEDMTVSTSGANDVISTSYCHYIYSPKRHGKSLLRAICETVILI